MISVYIIQQFLSNIKNMKSERFNNFLLKINRKFVWHTAHLYRINYIIYGFSDYISKYIKSMKIFVTFYIFENLFTRHILSCFLNKKIAVSVFKNILTVYNCFYLAGVVRIELTYTGSKPVALSIEPYP